MSDRIYQTELQTNLIHQCNTLITSLHEAVLRADDHLTRKVVHGQEQA